MSEEYAVEVEQPMKSAEIDKIGAALSKAQGAIQGASKDHKNPGFNSKYADLASVWDACRKPLSENEIAVTQIPSSPRPNVAQVTTLLIHSSGQWLRGDMAVDVSGGSDKINASQRLGSALTYLRRYSLAAMVGVAPDDDDDGQGADGANPVRAQTRTQHPARQTQEQRREAVKRDAPEVHGSAEAQRLGGDEPEAVTCAYCPEDVTGDELRICREKGVAPIHKVCAKQRKAEQEAARIAAEEGGGE